MTKHRNLEMKFTQKVQIKAPKTRIPGGPKVNMPQIEISSIEGIGGLKKNLRSWKKKGLTQRWLRWGPSLDLMLNCLGKAFRNQIKAAGKVEENQLERRNTVLKAHFRIKNGLRSHQTWMSQRSTPSTQICPLM